jgi:hypothetical protein
MSIYNLDGTAPAGGIVIDTSGTRQRVMIPAGEHIVTLKEVVLHRVTNNYSQDPDGKINKLMFGFLADSTQPGGNPYEYAAWTGTTYGDHRAALTQLLDMMIPGLAKGAKVALNSLVGNRYRALIQHRTNPNTGKQHAAHVYILPIDAASASTAVQQPPALNPSVQPPPQSPPDAEVPAPLPMATPTVTESASTPGDQNGGVVDNEKLTW